MDEETKTKEQEEKKPAPKPPPRKVEDRMIREPVPANYPRSRRENLE